MKISKPITFSLFGGFIANLYYYKKNLGMPHNFAHVSPGLVEKRKEKQSPVGYKLRVRQHLRVCHIF